MANQKINGGASPYPVTVGPADICTFADGADDAPLKSAVVNIEPVQNLNGYEYPWPAGGGKNLLLIKYPGRVNNDVTYVTNSDGTVSLSGIASGNSYFASNYGFNTDYMFRLDPGTYTISGSPNSNIRVYGTLWSTSGTSLGNVAQDTGAGSSFTVTEESWFSFQIYVSSGTNTGVTIYPQIERGDIKSAYAPYENICPITGWTQVDVVAAGKNLLDPTLLEIFNNSTYVRTPNYSTQGTIPVKPNTTYTLSLVPATGSADARVYEFDASNNRTQAFGAFGGTNFPVATFTTSATAKTISFYYKVGVAIASVAEAKPMLQLGSTATPYVAPAITPITISLGQTVYGGTLDVVSGKLVVDRQTIDLGSVAWTRTTTNTTGQYRFQTNEGAIGNVKVNTANGNTPNIISSNYAATSPDGTYAKTVGISVSTSGRIIVYDPNHDTETAATFKTSMSGVQAVYELATPLEYDVSPQTIRTLLGTNNIWADAGEMSIEYYPAQSSVVAVWDRTRHLYASIPLKYIRYDTYQINPSQAIDLDSYRSESGTLIRNVVGSKAKLEFNTPIMNDSQWSEVWGILSAGFNNTNEKKLKLKYYDTQSGSYKYGYFYVPDVNTQIMSIDEPNGVIQYNEIRLAFIEY